MTVQSPFNTAMQYVAQAKATGAPVSIRRTNVTLPASTIWGQDGLVPTHENAPFLVYNVVYSANGTYHGEVVGIIPETVFPPDTSKDEMFSAIIRKYSGGMTDETFTPMMAELRKNDLISNEQSSALHDAFTWKYIEAKIKEEGRLGVNFDFVPFILNYRFTFDDLLSELMGMSKRNPEIGKQQKIIREFAEKASAALRQSYPPDASFATHSTVP